VFEKARFYALNPEVFQWELTPPTEYETQNLLRDVVNVVELW
jgi:hypothetical protein